MHNWVRAPAATSPAMLQPNMLQSQRVSTCAFQPEHLSRSSCGASHVPMVMPVTKDPDSHTRMRIRSWVSFFKSATLMWWNTASTQNCTPCGGGNMYLGPLERSYNLVLRRFSGQMTDPTVQVSVVGARCRGARVLHVMPHRVRDLSDRFSGWRRLLQPLEVVATTAGVNAFGLRGAAAGGPHSAGDPRVIMVYLHHNTSHLTNITTGVEFGDAGRAGCVGEWLDPISGLITATVNTSGMQQPLRSPSFAIDAALRLVCNVTSP